MKKTNIFYVLKVICYIIICILLYILFFKFFDSFYKNNCVGISVESTGNMGEMPVEVFWSDQDDHGFTADRSQGITTDSTKDKFIFDGNIYLSTRNIIALRIDLGDKDGGQVTVKKLCYKDMDGYFCPTETDYRNAFLNDMTLADVQQSQAVFNITGGDPYMVFDTVKMQPYKNYANIMALPAAVIACFILIRFIRIKSVYNNILDIYSNRKLILNLAVNDFKTKYAGSYFGIVWAFVQPICTILVFWFVFQVGFRNSDVDDVPFILWFSAGIIPWFFFSEAWNTATNAFIEYSYLVKKVVFKINILPVVKIMSSLFVHMFFVLFLVFMFVCYGIFPTLYSIQILYYMLCMVALAFSLTLITAPLIIFFRDLGQVMSIVLQFGMWLTPIMWHIKTIPQNYQWLFKLNPMYYVVQGYRDSMMTQYCFFDNIKQTLFFWLSVSLFMLIGSVIYRKLKPHFADVL